MIQIRDLSKKFGENLIFQQVNLTIEQGDSLVIIGGSGCGKSTLLRCINRMETPSGGQILLDGADILAPGADLDRLRARIGMVYQSFNLFSHLNVLENMILAPIRVNRVPKRAAIEEALSLLALVGMDNRKFHMPSQLSGGQKQRVAIARCLIMHPEIILFDEPTSALDPTMVDEVQSVILRLVQEGLTSVMVTHEMDFARAVGKKIVFMAEQGIYEAGPPEQIFDAPEREKTRTFVDKLKVYEERIIGENLDIYSFMSRIRQYCIPYGYSRKQMNMITAIYEELIYPILGQGGAPEAVFRLRSSDRTGFKDVYLEFSSLTASALDHPAVDELGRRILRPLLIDETLGQEGAGVRLRFVIEH